MNILSSECSVHDSMSVVDHGVRIDVGVKPTFSAVVGHAQQALEGQ